MKKKSVLTKWLVTGLAVVTAVSLIGCGSSSMDSATTESVEVMYSNTATASDAKGFYGAVTEEAAEMDYETGTSSTSLENSGRKLIKEVSMSVETENFDDFLVEIERKINETGGYKEQYTVNGNGNDRYADITIRIPRAQLDAFLEVVEGASNITYRHETVEDVTLQYVDLESHKKMLYAEQERLLEFMSKAEEIEDVITLESRLTEVQYQIESMESQLRTFNNQIEYSTVYLDVNEVVRITPQEPKGMWERITTGFSEDLYEVGEDIKDGFVGFVIHIPSMIVSIIGFAFYILIAVIIVKVVIKVIAKLTNKNAVVDKKQQAPSQTVINNAVQPKENEEK
ncbi:MAG: DUF4349 domain-containing protein [Lachnospiraceae bacterium]|nr:DUF4349 domain-containing protein [Lachnospiraceae bacterium]